MRRLLPTIAALASLLVAACGSAEPALAQHDTVKVHVEVPTTTVVRVDTVRPVLDSSALVALRAAHAADSTAIAGYQQGAQASFAQTMALQARLATDSSALVARGRTIDSLRHLPPPVPPPPVHDTVHDTITVVKVVSVAVGYDSLAVDSMKIWRLDTSPPTDLAAMPITVGDTVPIRVDCFNHAKQQIACPAGLTVTSSDPSIATVTLTPPVVPVAPTSTEKHQ